MRAKGLRNGQSVGRSAGRTKCHSFS